MLQEIFYWLIASFVAAGVWRLGVIISGIVSASKQPPYSARNHRVFGSENGGINYFLLYANCNRSLHSEL